MLLKKFKYAFAWTYKNLKNIPPQLVQHRIELDTSIPLTHQARSRLNPNYVATIKQDINKLLVARLIQPTKEVTWLSLIAIMPITNGKMNFFCGFQKVEQGNKKRSISFAIF